jgi:NitT/TauT family transport system substrate-binding protein
MSRTAFSFVPIRRVAVVLAAAAVLGGAVPAAAETTVRVGTANSNEGYLPVRLASDQGFFKAEGITIEQVDFRGGGPAIQAFASNSVDLCVCASDHVVRLVNRGLDARIIVGLDGHYSYVLAAKAGAPYADLKSLKGKKIGITSPGSLTDNTIRWAIRQAGLQPERDFQIVAAGIGATMRAALETGQIDAGTVSSTDLPEMLKTGKFKIVTDWRTMEYPSLVVIGRQRWVTANPSLAKGFVRAIVKAQQLIQTNPQAAAKSLKGLYPNMSDQTIAELAASARSRLTKDGSVSVKAFETMQDVVLLSDNTLKRVKKAEVDIQPTLAK